MNTTYTTRLTSIALAALLTVVTNGSVLLSFDKLAQGATLAQSNRASMAVTLDTVTIVGRHS